MAEINVDRVANHRVDAERDISFDGAKADVDLQRDQTDNVGGQAATPLRDARYFASRVRTAQVITNPTSTDTVAFGSTVTFKRGDGRVQKYRIVGEDEADPKAGSISFASPVARLLMGKAVGDVAGTSGQELEIIAIS
jgi:transcription elongation GreA/GreB family factor